MVTQEPKRPEHADAAPEGRFNVVTTHQNADLDGVASMVAVHLLHGPLHLAMPEGMDPDTHRFWADHAADLPPLLGRHALAQRLEGSGLGTLWVVDTAVASRLGDLGRAVHKFEKVAAYDTHPPQENDLPRLPMSESGACVSALVLALAEAKVVPTPVCAGLFLVAIHQDTGHFTFATTTSVDHAAAATCWAWGAPGAWPARYVPKGFTRAQLALLESMGEAAEVVEVGSMRVGFIALELVDYEPNLAVLVEQLREAEGWPGALAVVTIGERAFCIGRSRGALNMAQIMAALGGGGHAEAASAVMRGLTFAEACKSARQALLASGVHHGEPTVGALAARPVHSAKATATVQAVADTLHQRRINAIVLTRGRGKGIRYVGVVTRAEVEGAQRHGMGQLPVMDVCAQAPTWIGPEKTLTQARSLLSQGPTRLLLVGNPPEAVGVLTRGLLLRALMPAAPHGQKAHPPDPQVVMGLVRKQVGALWPAVQVLAAAAERQGVCINLVGGSVRDLFLAEPGRDVDLVVEGDAVALANEAVATMGGTLTIEKDFGTAHWTPPELPSLDLATARSEYYASPAALPQVAHASLHQDLFRRDFTLNALAVPLCGPQAGRLVDPYGGLADLRAGVLRVLHGLSFHDDPTRALRAVRFAARFDATWAPDTAGLLKAALRAGVFEQVSCERLGAELTLLLNEREAVAACRMLRTFKLTCCVHPAWKVDRAWLTRLSEAREAYLRLAQTVAGVTQACVLFIVVAQSLTVGQRSERQRLLKTAAARERWLTGPERLKQAKAAFDSQDVCRWDRALAGLDAPLRVVAWAQCQKPAVRERMLWWESEGQRIKSSVDGHLLQACGYTQGPRFKAALAAALDAARMGQSPDAQLQAARKKLDG